MNEMCAVISCSGRDRDVFMEMSLRQVEEMLGVAEVRLIEGEGVGDTVALRLEKCKHGKCLRCRKLTAVAGDLCDRCTKVVTDGLHAHIGGL